MWYNTLIVMHDKNAADGNDDTFENNIVLCEESLLNNM